LPNKHEVLGSIPTKAIGDARESIQS